MTLLKTKVMHLIGHLKMGGAETLVTEYGLKINKEKFEMVVVTVGGRNNTINELKLKKAGIKIVFLGDKVPFSNTKNIFKRLFNQILRYILFLKIVNKEQPDIIHTHLRTNHYIVPLNLKKKKVKLFHTVHSEVEAMFNKTIHKLSTKYCIHRKNMTPIALHPKMQKEVNSYFNTESCILIRNGVDINRFKNVKVNKLDLLESLNIKNTSFIVGHVGRFSKAKNHKFLIKVFETVKKQINDAHLLLIGVGELEKQIKDFVKHKRLEDSVSFLGNRSDIPELMSIMDVFVFPSLYEGLGNVLIEAQATGTRCVVSNAIPKEAYVTDLVTSLSLNDSLEKWSQIIINSKTTQNSINQLKKHDINIIIKELENVYLSK